MLARSVSRVDLSLLVGIDRARDTLLANTLQFARGFAANNALLWGARGMGKSSLVKAVHAEVLRQGVALKIVELSREDLPSVTRLLAHLRAEDTLDIVLEFLALEQRALDYWLHDLLNDDLWEIIYLLGTNQIDELDEFVLNDANNIFYPLKIIFI